MSRHPTTKGAVVPPGVAVGPKTAPVERLALRLDEVASALGISRRALERERSAGRFPPPDLTVGRMPLWKPATIVRWIERGGAAS